ncbi:MAG: hypothetical protein HC904_12015 [Blastochloris sp.]|nr:hypothetical protein [Blastochloris sp.]
MSDRLTKAHRSRTMSRIRGKNTKLGLMAMNQSNPAFVSFRNTALVFNSNCQIRTTIQPF